jgi:signal transduction histidine kinase
LEDGSLSEKELKELLINSKESVSFMNKLTEDLLLLSILDQSIDVEKMSLIDITKHSIKQIKKFSENTGIKIKTEYSKEKVFVKGNAVLLERAIMNILENAIKYSECTLLEVEVKEKNHKAEISIKDNGKGISKKYLDKIFNRFYRVDKSRSRKTGGSGLGLSIAAKIVDAIGGSIYVDSSIGKGTVFTLKIPSV